MAKTKQQNFFVRFYCEITGSLHSMNLKTNGSSQKSISAAINREIMKNYGESSNFRLIHYHNTNTNLFS